MGAKSSTKLKAYFEASSTAYYSVIVAIPLLVSYEILLALTTNHYWRVRNAVDVMFRNVLIALEITPRQTTFVMIGLLIALIPLIQPPGIRLRAKYVGGMMVESFIYSLCLGFIIQLILTPLFLASPVGSGSRLQTLALSIGAGLFEEFFFRVVLISVLFFLLKPLLRSAVLTGTVTVVGASFLFALSHYVGNMGENFFLYSFLYRWVAGFLFTVLYFERGFGVTAYTHAFYDINLLLL